MKELQYPWEKENFDSLYEELCQAAEELTPWYDVDKVKTDSVYVYTKTTDDGNEICWGENVFDIDEDGIYYYVKDHVIPAEVMPIIKKIQEKIKALWVGCKGNGNGSDSRQTNRT